MESLYIRRFKRVLDIFFTCIGIVILSPLMLVIAILIKIFLGSPVFFKQQRPGLQGKIFTIYKFRTMQDIYDANGRPISDELRMTKLGQFLRNLSLDELPELLNVIKGEMSLVGPRPLLVEYLGCYNSEQMRRHLVKPGMTGWAQVNGRNNITWEEKFTMDLLYVENQSFVLDIKILFLTIRKVLSRENINQKGYISMVKFSSMSNNDVEL